MVCMQTCFVTGFRMNSFSQSSHLYDFSTYVSEYVLSIVFIEKIVFENVHIWVNPELTFIYNDKKNKFECLRVSPFKFLLTSIFSCISESKKQENNGLKVELQI